MLLSLTSVVLAVVVVEKGVRTAAVAWLAVAAVSLVFPGLQTALVFIGFFGPYPLVKAWVESRTSLRRAAAWALKYLFFDVVLAIGTGLVLGPLSGLYGGIDAIRSWAGVPGAGALFLALAFGAAQVFFVVYDVVLGRLIDFYGRRIRPAVTRSR
jgi:hypothetical protein